MKTLLSKFHWIVFLIIFLGLNPARGAETQANSCLIYLDWDQTFNCSLNPLDPTPCPWACDDLAATTNSCIESNESKTDESNPMLCSGSLRGISQQRWDAVMNKCGEPSGSVLGPDDPPCEDLRCFWGGGSGRCGFETKIPRLCAQASANPNMSIILIDNHCSPVDCSAYGYPDASIKCESNL